MRIALALTAFMAVGCGARSGVLEVESGATYEAVVFATGLDLALACGDSTAAIDGGRSDGALRDANPARPDRPTVEDDAGPPPRGFSGRPRPSSAGPANDQRVAATSIVRAMSRMRMLYEPGSSGPRLCQAS
jgi:hypothetical protein